MMNFGRKMMFFEIFFYQLQKIIQLRIRKCTWLSGCQTNRKHDRGCFRGSCGPQTCFSKTVTLLNEYTLLGHFYVLGRQVLVISNSNSSVTVLFILLCIASNVRKTSKLSFSTIYLMFWDHYRLQIIIGNFWFFIEKWSFSGFCLTTSIIFLEVSRELAGEFFDVKHNDSIITADFRSQLCRSSHLQDRINFCKLL